MTEKQAIHYLRHMLYAAQKARSIAIENECGDREPTEADMAFLAQLDPWLFDPRKDIIMKLQEAVECTEASKTLAPMDFYNWATICYRMAPAIGAIANLPFSDPDINWLRGWDVPIPRKPRKVRHAV